MFDLDDLRAVVAQETYAAYARLEGSDGLVELSVSDLRATLIHVCRDGRWETVGNLMMRVRTRPSLLSEYKPDVYVYPHPALQAYVAARHLVAQPDLPRLVSRLAREDFYRWREVISFALARLAWLEEGLPAALQVIDALCPRPLPVGEEEPPASEWRTAWLAGEALIEIHQTRESLDAPQTLDRVGSWLVATLDRGMLTPRERARAGSVLDRLFDGDPRPGVSRPEPVWCEVPASSAWFGDGDEARVVDVATFWISRYLVTNAQYAAFVRATGRASPRHWQGGRPPVGMGNHPVVGVTWGDATRYCEWRTEHLGAERWQVWRLGEIGTAKRPPRSWRVRLPTSVEWEKAARGGLSIPIIGHDELGDNPFPRRVYPWGDSWHLSTGEIAGDETRCNVSESDIGSTTPVGMYPRGASPYGVMDMAGNVWEWCLDWADDGNRYKIRRGGAFRYAHEHARCAASDKAYPGLAWPYLGFRVVLGSLAFERA
jgi:formylglycine-generating enzyme required for sulfatase activity